MKRFLIIIAMASLVQAAACSKPCSDATDSKEPAATVGGQVITMGELNKAAKDHLARIDTEIYQVKKKVLDSLVEERIITEAAKKENLSTDDYLAKEVDGKITQPTEDEVKALFDARKGAINKSFDEVRDQIRGYLEQNRKARARAELLARLRSEADVKISLSPPRVSIDTEGEPAYGEGSEIVLVEFSDYQCPFCKRVRPTVWKLVDEYDGKIKYVFMDFPLSFHREARKAHEAAHCAGEQGKYFDFNKKVFADQRKMSVDDLKAHAKEVGLDTEKFDQCLDSGKYADRIQQSIVKGAAAGVSGTPAFFINGILISGAQPYSSFKEVIESELSR